jgi:putative hydrolase of the HAD superfamily
MVVPDLTAIDTWLFDLDHTLYPPSVPILRLVEARIRDYMVRLTGLPADEAWALQKRYLDDYGGAVAGLVRHHGVDPHAFLADVHDVSVDSLSPDPELRQALIRLPGRRLIFTNGSARHAERVLARLGVDDVFEGVFHTEAAGLIMKPDPRAFDALIAAHAITPATTAFFEDRAVNLEPAARLGMTTILVGPDAAASTDAFVQHRTAALASFLNAARVKELTP